MKKSFYQVSLASAAVIGSLVAASTPPTATDDN